MAGKESVQRGITQNKAGKVGGNQTVEELKCQAKDFVFYPRNNRELLKNFE